MGNRLGAVMLAASTLLIGASASAQCTSGSTATIVAAIGRATGPAPTAYPRGAPVPAALRSSGARCEGGDPAACNAVGDHYREASRDERRARALYDRAADLERARGVTPPSVATPISAQAALRAFRTHWSTAVHPRLSGFFRQVADAEAVCLGRDGSYRIRRVSRRLAHQTGYRLIHELGGVFRSHLLDGDLNRLSGQGWVYEVMFGGGSNQLPPWGAFVAYVDGNGRVLVTVMWPEG